MEASHSPTVFDLPNWLESVNGGADRWSCTQMFPISGNVAAGTSVGTGNASNTTTFQFSDTSEWWSPCQSYFNMQLLFSTNGSVINNGSVNIVHAGATSPLVTYCDNFICTLFTQIQSQINSQSLDSVTVPWIVDTVLSYTKSKQNFLKSYASLTRLGEPLSTRLLNVSQNGGLVEVNFRPPLAIFDTKILPPGAQFRFDFIWAATAALAFEALLVNPITIGDTAYQIKVNSFSFHKVSLHPAPDVAIGQRGVIDLWPTTANQYSINGASQLQQQFVCPATTNRIMVVFQDGTNAPIAPMAAATGPLAPVNNITGVGGGYTPATSFTSTFIKAGTTLAATGPVFGTDTTYLSQLWLTIPELNISEPRPPYQFDATNKDQLRAYTNWAQICQGTHVNSEGSIPYGNNDPSKGITIIAPAAVGATGSINIYQPGDPANYQQITICDPTDTVVLPITLNNLSRWGWAGTRPGPMYPFPIIRPENKTITGGVLYAYTNESVKNVTVTIISSYNMAIVVNHVGNGQYSYDIVAGA